MCLLEKCLKLEQAWHPLIKKIIKDQFVCHDLNLCVIRPTLPHPGYKGQTTCTITVPDMA